MRITEDYKKSIAKTFYDKEIQRYSIKKDTDDEGWVGEEVLQEGKSFYGNVQYGNLGRVLKEQGVEIEGDLAITTNETCSIGEILGFGNYYYKVSKFLKYDTHNLIVCDIWQERQSLSV